MRRPALASLCLLVLAAGSAAAQSSGVYKWKDARGVTHYGDTPPAGSRYASVQADAAARVAPAAKPDARCVTARTNLERLASASADIGLDANGDGKPDAPMTEAMRADQRRMAEAALKNFCTPAAPAP